MKNLFILSSLLLIFTMLLCACGAEEGNDTLNGETDAVAPTDSETTAPEDEQPKETLITFSGADITVQGEGAAVTDLRVDITSPGTYRLSGASDNARVCVSVAKTEQVILLFDGIDLSSVEAYPIAIYSADKTTVVLCDGTENFLTDTVAATDIEANATLYSKDDLNIEGNGSLTVNAKSNNGIVSKNDLKIKGGTITVNAVNHGLRGNDSVRISAGKIVIQAVKDGVKAANATDDNTGYISVTGGSLKVTAGDDALQSVAAIYLHGGRVEVKAGGKITNCAGTVEVLPACEYIK